MLSHSVTAAPSTPNVANHIVLLGIILWKPMTEPLIQALSKSSFDNNIEDWLKKNI